jgi:hypothetical protein
MSLLLRRLIERDHRGQVMTTRVMMSRRRPAARPSLAYPQQSQCIMCPFSPTPQPSRATRARPSVTSCAVGWASAMSRAPQVGLLCGFSVECSAYLAVCYGHGGVTSIAIRAPPEPPGYAPDPDPDQRTGATAGYRAPVLQYFNFEI